MFEINDSQKEIIKKYSDRFKDSAIKGTDKLKTKISDLQRGNKFVIDEKTLEKLFDEEIETSSFTNSKNDPNIYLLSLTFKDKHTEIYQIESCEVVKALMLQLIQQGKFK